MYGENRIGNRKFHLKLLIIVFFKIRSISLIRSEEFRKPSNTCFSLANSCCRRCNEEDNEIEDCYCEYICSEFEDCCEDYEAVCRDLKKDW